MGKRAMVRLLDVVTTTYEGKRVKGTVVELMGSGHEEAAYVEVVNEETGLTDALIVVKLRDIKEGDVAPRGGSDAKETAPE